jgi:hypothetical protein
MKEVIKMKNVKYTEIKVNGAKKAIEVELPNGKFQVMAFIMGATKREMQNAANRAIAEYNV